MNENLDTMAQSLTELEQAICDQLKTSYKFRKRTKYTSITLFILFLVGGPIAFPILMMYSGQISPDNILTGIYGSLASIGAIAIFLFVVSTIKTSNAKIRFKEEFIEPILIYIAGKQPDQSRYFKATAPFSALLRYIQLRPDWENLEISDCIFGIIDSHCYSFIDFELTHQRSGGKHKYTITDFRGQCFILPVPQRVQQPFYINPNSGNDVQYGSSRAQAFATAIDDFADHAPITHLANFNMPLDNKYAHSFTTMTGIFSNVYQCINPNQGFYPYADLLSHGNRLSEELLNTTKQTIDLTDRFFQDTVHNVYFDVLDNYILIFIQDSEDFFEYYDTFEPTYEEFLKIKKRAINQAVFVRKVIEIFIQNRIII